MDDAATVLAYVLPSLVVLAVVTLWFLAVSEIQGHARRGLSTKTQLAVMAAAVSAVAALAVAGAGTTFPGGRFPDVPVGEIGARELGKECVGVRGTFVFSFGLEQPLYDSPSCGTRLAGEGIDTGD